MANTTRRPDEEMQAPDVAGASSASTVPEKAPKAFKQQSQGPYSSPSGFAAFDRQFGANAGAANAAANRMGAAATDRVAKARQGLAASTAAFNAAGNTGPYQDAQAQQQYLNAGQYLDNLGNAAGVQANAGPNATAWGAGLTQAAGQRQFNALQQQFGNIDGELVSATTAANAQAEQRARAQADLDAQVQANVARIDADREAERARGRMAEDRYDPSLVEQGSTEDSIVDWLASLFGGN